MAKAMAQNYGTQEIIGKPGALWGPLPIPMKGRVTVKVTGDILLATTTSGMTKQTLRVRIKNIDNIEIQEAPKYFLLIIGGMFALSGGLGLLGAIVSLFLSFDFLQFILAVVINLIFLVPSILLILYATNNKSRLMTFRTPCAVLPVFLTMETGIYEQFGNNVLGLARQLNMLSSPTTARKPQVSQASQNQPIRKP